MRFSPTTLSAILTLLDTASAAIVYVQGSVSYVDVTASPSENLVTVTASNYAVKTIDSTVSVTTTLYKASTTPVTVYTGSVITELSTVEPDRVSKANITQSIQISKTLSPSDYTAPVKLTPTADAVVQASSTASAASSSLTVPASTFATLYSSSQQSSTITSSADTSVAVSSSTYSSAAHHSHHAHSSSVSSVYVAVSSSSIQESSAELVSSESSFIAPVSSSTEIVSSTINVQSSSAPVSSTVDAQSSTVDVSSSTEPASSSSSSSSSSLAPSSSSSTPSSSSTSSAASSTESSTSGGNGVTYSEGTDIFQAISTDDVPDVFTKQDLAITLSGAPTDGSPIHTNKFYANMFLDDQTNPAYVQPYSVWWSTLELFPGLGVSYTTASQRVFGPDASADPVEYFSSPVGLISLDFSAEEFTSDNMKLSISDSDTFSVLATLQCDSGSIDFPLVQGMGFVTAKYDGKLTPKIYSQIGIDTFVKSSDSPDGVDKYVATLFNEINWVIYVTISDGSDFSLSVDSTNGYIIGSSASEVIIQAAVLPDDTESSYDQAAGQYPVSGTLSGSVNSDASASWAITYKTEGESSCGSTLMHALPHHLESFAESTSSKATNIQLNTATKGTTTAYLTNSFEFNENLNQNIQFHPVTENATDITYSADVLQLIATVANDELALAADTNLDSNYFSGKAFDRLAYILLVVNDILGASDVSQETLDRLKTDFAVFTSNTQQHPLMYDTLLKGVTSTAAQEGDTGTDFGSPYYNDHHFHYSYFIHAAAVVGYVDKQFGGTWAEDNKDWVNSLIRDVANPSHDDTYFPVSRSFDWYSGHSWAKGLFISSDGKDQESSSEDYNFAYGMKLWGKVIGDGSMEARGDLMLAVMAKALDNYYYYKDDNSNEPSNFIANRVPGITFENKLDHITYFGSNLEYIQGIHMIPLTPVSNYMRTPTFVEQEWNSLISSLVDTVTSGWLGILRANQAIFDPVSSYNFFAQDDFSNDWLDGGASRTWYLAYSAGLGGAN